MQSPNTAQDVPRTVRNRTPLAFLSAIPIAILGGLIGLGGAEFRLPVLAGMLGYSARKAVPLNLAVSLTTIIASLLIRGRTLSLSPLVPFVPSMLALIGGAVVAALCLGGSSLLADATGIIDWEQSGEGSEIHEAVAQFMQFAWLRHAGWVLAIYVALSAFCAAWLAMVVLAVTGFWVKDDTAPSTKALARVCLRLLTVGAIAGGAGLYGYLGSGRALNDLARAPIENIAEFIAERPE